MLWPFMLFAQGMEKAKQQDTDGAFLLDTTVTYYQVPAGEGQPDVAFDGENYMGVWSRNGTIVVGRVTKQGVLIDTNGIVVKKSNQCFHPAIAYGNGYYFVTWEDGLGYNPDRIYFARVSKTGIVLDTQAILVGKLLDQMRPDVASDGTNFFIVWEDANQGDIRGAIVDTSGLIIKSNFKIAYAPGGVRDAAVTFGGGYYLVAWNSDDNNNDPHGIYAARITPQGNVLIPEERGILITDKTEWGDKASVAYGNGKYLVAWNLWYSNEKCFDVYCSRVDTNGQVLDTAGIVVSNKNNHNESWAAVTFNDSNFVVCWNDRRIGYYELYGARIDTAGHNLDTAGIWLGDNYPSGSMPAIAKGDTSYLLIWTDGRNPSSDIYGEIINPDLSFQNNFPVAQYVDTLANNEFAPAVAFDGNGYMASFISCQNDRIVCTANIDSAGNILGKFDIDTCYASATQIAFGDSVYLIAWIQSNVYIKYAILSRASVPIDTIKEFYDSFYINDLALCWGDTTWLASWFRDGFYPSSPAAGMCRRIGNSGALLGGNIEIQSGYAGLSSIAYDGTRVLVVYKHDVITGRFVDENGATSTDSILFPSTGDSHHASVAFDGINYMVVWHDSLAGGDYNIYAARVNPTGVLADTTALTICDASGSQRNPIVVYNGSYYTVLWEDYRNGTQWDIFGARVAKTGQIINHFTASTMTGDKSELAAGLAPVKLDLTKG